MEKRSLRVKELKEFPDYVIREDGKVFNKKRMETPLGVFKVKSGKFAFVNIITKDRIVKKANVAQLVGENFKKNPHKYPYAYNMNGDVMNNAVNNIGWTVVPTNKRKVKQQVQKEEKEFFEHDKFYNL